MVTSIRYLIFFQPRSGSTYIASRLNAIRRGIVNGFELAAREAALNYGLIGPEEYSKFGPEAKLSAMQRFFEFHRDASHVGFKVAPYQILDDIAGYLTEAQRQCGKLIFLYREDAVQTALSQMWSLERGRSGQVPALMRGQEHEFKKMHIERDLFEYYVVDSILGRELVLGMAKACRVEKLVIGYESFYANVAKSFKGLKAFLRIDGRLPASKLVRIRPIALEESVVNWDDVLRWAAPYVRGSSRQDYGAELL